MSTVAERVQSQRSGQTTNIDHPRPRRREPNAVGHGGPQHADDHNGRREDAAGRHVREHGEAPEPRGGQDDERDEHDEELLPGDHHAEDAEAGAREQLVQVVPFQDEEADGHEVELRVEERRRDEPPAPAERELADLRVRAKLAPALGSGPKDWASWSGSAGSLLRASP
nr:unnamed protein product [Digitaria exilis]